MSKKEIRTFQFQQEVLCTYDLSIFKKLDGNRPVLEMRKNKIKKSILENGYIPSAIVVNERLEIIDGQGRVAALKEIGGLPVYYIVVPGLGVDECIAMNFSMTNWTTMDYIRSFADRGNESYIKLKWLIEKYNTLFNLSVVIQAVTGSYGGYNLQHLWRGDFKMDEEDLAIATGKLEFLKEFKGIYKGCADKNLLQKGLLIAFDNKDCDNARMITKLKNTHNVGGYRNTEEVLDFLSDVYNFRAHSKIDLKHDHKFDMSAKHSWYEKKWGLVS